jgi:hypothetical protein
MLATTGAAVIVLPPVELRKDIDVMLWLRSRLIDTPTRDVEDLTRRVADVATLIRGFGDSYAEAAADVCVYATNGWENPFWTMHVS